MSRTRSPGVPSLANVHDGRHLPTATVPARGPTVRPRHPSSVQLRIDFSPRRSKRAPVAGLRATPRISRTTVTWAVVIVAWIGALRVASPFGDQAFWGVHVGGIALLAANRFWRWRRAWLRQRRPQTAARPLDDFRDAHPAVFLAEGVAASVAVGSSLFHSIAGGRPLWWHVMELVVGLGVAVVMWRSSMATDDAMKAHLAELELRHEGDPRAAARRTAGVMRDPTGWISAPPPALAEVTWQLERRGRRTARPAT